MKDVHRNILTALAVACLLAMPALSMPFEKGAFDGSRMDMGSHMGIWLLMDDVTEEELNNMTLAEIKDLKEQKMAELENMTLGEIKDLQQQKMDETIAERESMTLGEIKELRDGSDRCMGPGMGPAMDQKGWGMGPGMGQGMGPAMDQKGWGMGPGMGQGMGPAQGHGMYLWLLMDDVTEEELNNMTLAEIEDLKEQKMAELENMTLGEIKDLQQQKMDEKIAELEGMTLGELKEQAPNQCMRQCSGFGR